MFILETQDLDLLTPFPKTELPRIWGWLHCYKTFPITETTQSNKEEIQNFFKGLLAKTKTWGLIDKDNKLKMSHEVPLVGLVMWEHTEPTLGFLHVTGTRKAWKAGFAEQAAKAVVESIWSDNPGVDTICSVILSNNDPARHLLKALGFRKNYFLNSAETGAPKSVIHFKLTREK